MSEQAKRVVSGFYDDDLVVSTSESFLHCDVMLVEHGSEGRSTALTATGDNPRRTMDVYPHFNERSCCKVDVPGWKQDSRGIASGHVSCVQYWEPGKLCGEEEVDLNVIIKFAENFVGRSFLGTQRSASHLPIGTFISDEFQCLPEWSCQ